MRVCLVGADFEENLGVGTIASAVSAAGHKVNVVPFNDAVDSRSVVRAILKTRPDVVGLSMQFQHRSHDFLRLCAQLREAGFRGHVTSGGRYPTAAWQEVLSAKCGLSSVVMFEGEETVVALLDAIDRRERLHDVPGLALLSDDGVPCRTAHRPIPDGLDPLPLPLRYRQHSRHLGVPFIPIMASRGCWGRCTYCSITSFYRDARQEGDSLLLRLRSPHHVAEEMAVLWHAAGGPCLFCFHDDNLLLPRPADTLKRLREIRQHLDRLGVGKVGIIGKARPDCVTAELAHELADLGVIRLYVGVENASDSGALNLGRGRQTAHVREALQACREAGIFVCYNLLIFEPASKLDDIRENIAFIREHPQHPINFCRAEPYHGTILYERLKEQSQLSGSYLGWNYRLQDDRTELLFRICAAAFRERNFHPVGVANRSMSLGYLLKVLEYFYEDRDGARPAFARRAGELTRGIATQTASFLEQALAIAEHAPLADTDRIERETAALGLAIAGADVEWLAAMDELEADMDAYARKCALRDSQTRRLVGKTKKLAQQLALGASLMTWAATQEACAGCVVDPVPSDGGVDAGRDAGKDAGMVVDPPPPDAGRDAGMVVDPPPPDAGMDAGTTVVDPPPPDAGMDAGTTVVDPPPPDASVPDAQAALHRPAGGWRDSSPRSSIRSTDLPLYQPPAIALSTRATKDGVHVALNAGDAPVSVKWQAEGEVVVADEHNVDWQPKDRLVRLRVAVRSRGGVAVVSVGAGNKMS